MRQQHIHIHVLYFGSLLLAFVMGGVAVGFIGIPNLSSAAGISSLRVSGNLVVGGNINGGGNLTMAGDTTIGGKLGVTGPSTLSGNVSASSDLNVAKNLNVVGIISGDGSGLKNLPAQPAPPPQLPAGPQIVTKVGFASTAAALCPAGTKVTGGGCDTNIAKTSIPQNNGWFCRAAASGANITAFALCLPAK